MSNNDAVTSVPALKRFKCLSAKLESATSAAHTGCDTPQSQLNKFMLQIKELQQHPDAVAFWQEHRATYSCLADTGLDFVAAPASQAYVERVFSVCGMLTQGRRNRMSKSLEMRVRLKLNVKLIG